MVLICLVVAIIVVVVRPEPDKPITLPDLEKLPQKKTSLKTDSATHKKSDKPKAKSTGEKPELKKRPKKQKQQKAPEQTQRDWINEL